MTLAHELPAECLEVSVTGIDSPVTIVMGELGNHPRFAENWLLRACAACGILIPCGDLSLIDAHIVRVEYCHVCSRIEFSLDRSIRQLFVPKAATLCVAA